MAFKDTQTLTCLLFIWLNLIEVSTFVTLNEERSNLVGSFNKNARAMESFDRGYSKAKSGAQIGRLVIGQTRTPNDKGDGDPLSSDVSSHKDKNAYQSDDAGRMNLEPLWEPVYGLNTLYTPAVEQLRGMKPKVDCVGDLMKLTIHGRDASFGSNFLIDRGSISPLPLSQLPSECGHTLLRTWRDFVFVIPHDGCYVSQERNTYILPLLWWGLPLKMSCSSSTLRQSSPNVSCYTNGMIVKLQRDAAVNLRVKVMNEWHPLMKASAKCGYSLVSHPEGMAIHAPYMPCTEAKDGMFTLGMATEREFNLSCPALSLSFPISESDRPSKSDASIPSSLVSSTLAPTTIASVKTTKPTECQKTTTSSTTQKLFPIPLPYHIPDHPYFKPVTPNYPFLLFQPNMPPTVAPLDTKAVVTPSPINQRPPVYPKPSDPKPPQTWYPWYPKPNLIPAPKPTKSFPVPPPREPVLPPTKAPKPSLSPLVYLLKPTSIPIQDKTTPSKPPVQSVPVYPPRKLVYPGSVDSTSVAVGQVPQWLYPFQTRPRPDEPPRLKPFEQHALPKPELAPPILAPTKKAESPQLLHFPWYKPYPQKHLEMPSVPIKVPLVPQSESSKPQSSNVSSIPSIKGPPANLHFYFSPSTYPTSAPSKNTQVARTSAPTKASLTQFNWSHALFHCPTFCPGPPSISYHHHNHHHFAHSLPVPYLGTSRLTKLTAEIQSSPIQPPISSFIQGMGYNYSPYSSKVEALAPAAQYVAPAERPVIKPTRAPASEPLIRPTLCPYIFRTLALNSVSSQSAMKPANIPLFVRPWEPTKPPSRSSQNAPIVESVAHSVQSPTPALYQAEMQHNILQGKQLMPAFVAPNNAGPFSQSQHEVSLKPTTDDESLSNNYWYQLASYLRPPMSDAPAEFSKLASVNNDHTSLQSTMPSQPKQTQDMDLPIQMSVHPSMQIRNTVPVHTQLYDHQKREPSVPIFRDPEPFGSYWLPAVQSNQKTVHSTHYPDGSMRGPLRFVLRHMG